MSAVVAVWLWGSGGRGDDDALSDWDIFVALADASDLTQLDPARRVGQFGDVLSWHEDSFNAPTEGRYVAAAYPGPYSPMPVD
jgi:predicted nucleotidyltransferase